MILDKITPVQKAAVDIDDDPLVFTNENLKPLSDADIEVHFKTIDTACANIKTLEAEVGYAALLSDSLINGTVGQEALADYDAKMQKLCRRHGIRWEYIGTESYSTDPVAHHQLGVEGFLSALWNFIKMICKAIIDVISWIIRSLLSLFVTTKGNGGESASAELPKTTPGGTVSIPKEVMQYFCRHGSGKVEIPTQLDKLISNLEIMSDHCAGYLGDVVTWFMLKCESLKLMMDADILANDVIHPVLSKGLCKNLSNLDADVAEYIGNLYNDGRDPFWSKMSMNNAGFLMKDQLIKTGKISRQNGINGPQIGGWFIPPVPEGKEGTGAEDSFRLASDVCPKLSKEVFPLEVAPGIDLSAISSHVFKDFAPNVAALLKTIQDDITPVLTKIQKDTKEIQSGGKKSLIDSLINRLFLNETGNWDPIHPMLEQYKGNDQIQRQLAMRLVNGRLKDVNTTLASGINPIARLVSHLSKFYKEALFQGKKDCAFITLMKLIDDGLK